MNLPQLPLDKAMHSIYGGGIAAVAACVAIALGRADLAAYAALAAAAVAGVAKEIIDKRTPGAEVSIQDVTATAAGGLVVASPLIVAMLKVAR